MNGVVRNASYAAVLLAVGLTGCKADLLPLRMPGYEGTAGFCNRDKTTGKLIVRIHNGGSENANASTTQVDFFSHGSKALPTPALQKGDTKEFLIDVPAGCYSPDCSFRITADSEQKVEESNETNNVGDGICLG